jgi:hypothetical protein
MSVRGGHGGVDAESTFHGGGGSGGCIAIDVCDDQYSGSFESRGGLTLLSRYDMAMSNFPVDYTDTSSPIYDESGYGDDGVLFVKELQTFSWLRYKQVIVSGAAGSVARKQLSSYSTSSTNAHVICQDQPAMFSLSSISWDDKSLFFNLTDEDLTYLDAILNSLTNATLLSYKSLALMDYVDLNNSNLVY